jgi:hypothetical protein
VAVSVAVEVTLGVGVAVAVTVAVPVWEAVGETVAVAVDCGVLVDVAVGTVVGVDGRPDESSSEQPLAAASSPMTQITNARTRIDPPKRERRFRSRGAAMRSRS